MSEKQKLDQETAEQEFARFAEDMRLNRRLQVSRESDKQSVIDAAKASVIRGLRDGQIVINDKGEAVFYPESDTDNPITFHLPKGSTLMASDQAKEGQTIRKLYLQLSQMTGETTGRFADMPMHDLDIVQDIWLLFFG